jgi:outer membrane biosynthesis protein TonB
VAKALSPSIDLKLPWSSSDKEDKRFTTIAVIFLLIVFISGLWLQSVVLPEVDRKDLEKLPPQLAKVIIKKKEKPKPPPVVKPIDKPPEEKKPEEKKPEEKKPEEKKPEKKPEIKITKAEKVKEAREVAKKSGLLAMKDDLAAMRQLSSASFANAANKNLSNAGAKGVSVNRSVIVGNSTGTSGGIRTAGTPGASGVGLGGGGRGATQVDSVTLGGAVVDGGGGVEDAVASSRSAGSRSEEMIRAVLDQNKAALYQIYTRALRSDPALQGKVTFELVIEPDGSVSQCKIINSELNDASLGNKLVSRMRLINFGPDDVSVTTTRWSIDFLPY